MPTARVKDAGFLQKHVEKIALGLGVLILIIAFVIFVAGNPFKIVINNREYASPREAVEELEMNNTRLKLGLQESNPIPPVVIPQFDNEVIAMLDREVTKATPARFASAGLTDKTMTPEEVLPPRYIASLPPVPTNVRTVVGTDVLDMQLNQPTEAYAKLLGEISSPMDVTMFIASAEFPIYEWAQRLRKPTGSAEGGPIPTGIWSQRFGIAGVALLREEWNPYTQSWGERTIVPALPGQPRLLPGDEAPSDPLQAGQTVVNLRERQEDIARPELPWIGGLVQAVAPGSELAEGGIDEFGIEGLGKAESEIVELEKKIQLLEEERMKREERRRPNPDRPVARPTRPGEFDEGTTRPERDTTKQDPYAKRIEQYRTKIERLRPRAEIERAEREKRAEERAKREALAEQRKSLLNQNNDPRFATGDENAEEIDGIRLEEDAKVRVWAADLTMKPGKTYRYKVLVSVINPLYAVPRLDTEQREENKALPALLPPQAEIDKMPWSDPVSVEPKVRYFFTSGSESRATVVVYRRIAGEMRKQKFDITPGDVVGGSATIDGEQLDLSVGLILIDLETRRDPFGGTSTVMILMNPETGEIFERTQATDNASPVIKKLDQEIKEGKVWKLRPTGEEPLDFGPGEFNERFIEEPF